MATILFGKTDAGEVFEVRVKAARVQPLLSAGYVCDPAEFEEAPNELEEDAEVLDASASEVAALSEDDLRAEAREKGIRNWHNKKIETLKRELGYGDSEG